MQNQLELPDLLKILPMNRKTTFLPLTFSLSLLATLSAAADDQFFQSSGDTFAYSLNDTSSWNNSVIPGPADLAIFDNRTLASTIFCTLDDNLDVLGIKVLDPQSLNVTSGLGISGRGSVIDGEYRYDGVLSIGSEGIDLSAATPPAGIFNSYFTIGTPLTLTADQTWNVPQLLPNLQRSLNISGSSFSSTRRTALIDFGGHTAIKTGDGTASLLHDCLPSNGTLIVEDGHMAFGNSINNNRDTNIIQDIADTFILQINPSGQADIIQATTTDRGQVNWEGSIVLNGGILGLNTGDFLGELTLGGTLEALTGTESQIIYDVDATAPNASFITIAAPLSGAGDILIKNTSTRSQDRLVLSGDNTNHTGTLTLSGGNFLATNEAGTTNAIIDSGTTIGGNGTLGELTIPEDSAIYPGDGGGDTDTLFTGPLTINGELRIDYNSIASDTLFIDGPLALENATLVFLEGASPAALGTYTIATASSITGFTDLKSQNIPAGYTLEVVHGGLEHLVLKGTAIPANFTAWIAQFPALSPADAQANADPDRDGFDNLIEFVLDSDPTKFQPEKAPKLSFENGNTLFSFPRYIPAHNTGNRAIIEWATDLDTEIWNELRLTIVSSDDAFDYTSTVIPVSLNAPRVFARIRVTPPN